MLIIRDAQMAAFRADAERRFEERMRAYVAEEHPAHHRALGDEGTRRIIRAGLAAAARHGLEGEGPTAVLIELMVEYGERFERSPERAFAERILAHPGLPGQVKVVAIRERFAERSGGRTIVPVAASPDRGQDG